MRVFFLTILIGAASSDHHARTNQLPDRSTIVHLFEWKWKDIADECEKFLGPKGFGGVQVSPPSENLMIEFPNGTIPWYERYEVMSYKIKTRSGNEEEFSDMTRRCNRVGVRIYADVVLNDMAGEHPESDSDGVGSAGSTVDFKNFNYSGVPYQREHFHEPCSIDSRHIAQQVRDCQLNGLKDLNHRNDYVRQRIVNFLNKLISLGVAGFRVHAAKNMWPEDLRAIYSKLNGLSGNYPNLPTRNKPYIYQQVIYYGDEAVKPFEYTELGDVTEFRVGTELTTLFRGRNALKLLASWERGYGVTPSEKAVVFIDNHETQRNNEDVLTYKEARAYRAAVAFLLAFPYGEPRVMSSYHFDNVVVGPPDDKDANILSPINNANNTCVNGWICEHRWHQIYQMVAFRNKVRGTGVILWWDNLNNQIAFSRGDKGFIAFNLEKFDMNQTIKCGLPPGEYCDVISGERDGDLCTGLKLTVDDVWREVYVNIPSNAEDMHIAIHVGPESSLQAAPFHSKERFGWIRERDPLPPLTPEATSHKTRRPYETRYTHGHYWPHLRDPLPPPPPED